MGSHEALSVDPFKRLVKLVARAFYDDMTTKGDKQPKTGRSDNRGIAVVVLDALTRLDCILLIVASNAPLPIEEDYKSPLWRRQWVREEDLAKDLKLHSKQLRRTLRFFEEEKLVTRDHRKETAKGAKIYSAAVAATGDGQPGGREGDEKLKMHTHSYCCLDYAQIYDVVRYRLHRMKKKLKDELESKNTVQEYICPNCSKRYTALDALRLISLHDEYFHCQSCDGVLVAEADKLAAQELGDVDDNARRRLHEKLKDILQNMEEQLKPLMDQLGRVKDLTVPEFGSLQAWELQNAAGRAANGDHENGPYKSSRGFGFGGTPMRYIGETKVEVAFSGVDGKGENIKLENGNAPMKVLPPWMIRKGMKLTDEQRGETQQEAKMAGGSTAVESSDDKKPTDEKDDVKNIQDEYVKAYYAALLTRQREQEAHEDNELQMSNASTSNGVTISSERQVGMKSKRGDDYEGGDVEWDKEPPAGNTTKNFKINDLNVEAEASDGDEDEDDIDWEEG